MTRVWSMIVLFGCALTWAAMAEEAATQSDPAAAGEAVDAIGNEAAAIAAADGEPAEIADSEEMNETAEDDEAEAEKVDDSTLRDDAAGSSAIVDETTDNLEFGDTDLGIERQE